MAVTYCSPSRDKNEIKIGKPSRYGALASLPTENNTAPIEILYKLKRTCIPKMLFLEHLFIMDLNQFSLQIYCVYCDFLVTNIIYIRRIMLSLLFFHTPHIKCIWLCYICCWLQLCSLCRHTKPLTLLFIRSLIQSDQGRDYRPHFSQVLSPLLKVFYQSIIGQG